MNFNTIARSYRILDELGIISTQQGRGTYITNLPPPVVSAEIRQQALQALTRRFLAEAGRLGVTPQEVEQTLQAQVADWQRSGRLSNPEPDTE